MLSGPFDFDLGPVSLEPVCDHVPFALAALELVRDTAGLAIGDASGEITGEPIGETSGRFARRASRSKPALCPSEPRELGRGESKESVWTPALRSSSSADSGDETPLPRFPAAAEYG